MDGVQISIRGCGYINFGLQWSTKSSSWALCSLIADYAAVFHGCLPPVLGLFGKIGLCQMLI
ncbi:hypothetical protein PoMZ_02578 [Pyricularia oryzae]|uniref:Uncharacterized protein n=1 Tax=Pyricularia oryzae TaxID=318829 RepID=A0A4V1C5U9_PYROR|nr:hypothetical protein PoMZ_02578 [Pyricularia oryzae]